jgi:hypothetical protein
MRAAIAGARSRCAAFVSAAASGRLRVSERNRRAAAAAPTAAPPGPSAAAPPGRERGRAGQRVGDRETERQSERQSDKVTVRQFMHARSSCKGSWRTWLGEWCSCFPDASTRRLRRVLSRWCGRVGGCVAAGVLPGPGRARSPPRCGDRRYAGPPCTW